MKTLEQKFCALARKHFRRDMPSRTKKLCEEFAELIQAIVSKDRAGILDESADVSFVLMDICQLNNGRLSRAQRVKWEVLMDRKRKGVLHKRDRIKRG